MIAFYTMIGLFECYYGITIYLWQFQDDGELYVEFRDIKHKFRAKTEQLEVVQLLPVIG